MIEFTNSPAEPQVTDCVHIEKGADGIRIETSGNTITLIYMLLRAAASITADAMLPGVSAKECGTAFGENLASLIEHLAASNPAKHG